MEQLLFILRPCNLLCKNVRVVIYIAGKIFTFNAISYQFIQRIHKLFLQRCRFTHTVTALLSFFKVNIDLFDPIFKLLNRRFRELPANYSGLHRRIKPVCILSHGTVIDSDVFISKEFRHYKP